MGAGHEVGPIIGGVAGDDAVVILRIALSFGERLLAAIRAPVEIRMLRRRSIERANDSFACFSGDVDAAMRVIDDLIHASLRPMAVIVRSVAGVRAGGGVAAC